MEKWARDGKVLPFYRPRFIMEYSRMRGHSHQGSPSVNVIENNLLNNRTVTSRLLRLYCLPKSTLVSALIF
jgi:hypothetical protein